MSRASEERMWTNVFKIGGLHHISWFQFLPHELDSVPASDESERIGQKDVSMLAVLSSHLQLQKEGFLSTWTNSFVGPWDPSQGLHNPDEKLKLWLFLPGRHSSVSETAQVAVSKLRVVASGLWLAPGDSEEVASALSQALRNCIERALKGLSYMRFGDVFSRCNPSSINEELFRRGQPTVEFVFTATEEAIFVHVIISAKYVRPLSSGDMESALKHSSDSNDKLQVVVSPHGMRGRLTGFCPSDLVKQVYFSSSDNHNMSNGFIALPHHLSHGSVCQLRGQNYYVEVTLGLPSGGNGKSLQNDLKNNPKHQTVESHTVRNVEKESLDLMLCEKTFIYPMEAVLVPVLQTTLARSSLKRFWLQNWTGPSLSDSSFFMPCKSNMELDGPWAQWNGAHTNRGDDSSSNSNGSSISSLSSSSAGTDSKVTKATGDLDADADSLTCRQSGLSTNDQIENDRHKQGSKRPRTGMDSYGQVGSIANTVTQDGYGSMEVTHSAITGAANEQIGSRWDWDEDDKGMGMDIQVLLSEFGDFGDFFENDSLPFGEPPGTAESHALMFSAPDCGDVGSSPCTGMMDVSDSMLLPAVYPSFDNFNPVPPAPMEEAPKFNHEAADLVPSGPLNSNAATSSGDFDHLIRAEALMTFAPEYGAVEPLSSELSFIFKNPYLPKSCKAESSSSSQNSYVYSATPPLSPCIVGSNDKSGISVNYKASNGRHDITKTYYSLVDSGREKLSKQLISSNNIAASREGAVSSTLSGLISSDNSAQSKQAEPPEVKDFFMSMKNVLATEVECISFQASMCRVRHMLVSSSCAPPSSLNHFTEAPSLSQFASEPSTMTDNVSTRYETKKRDPMPIRIAGDFDGGLLDGSLSATVGVWRSVGVSKGGKHSNTHEIEVSPTLTRSSFNEEGILSYGQRQPLQELLDGMSLLVQQATSLVDVALDADSGDGPFGWLALQEQCRRGFSCGPAMVHAGCGGSLASCHFLDIAGVELVDPLSVDVHASSVINLLQSDMKAALKSAFVISEGPLSVTDWCRGCSQPGEVGTPGDGYSAESTISECRESSSTIGLCVDPISPSISSASGSSGLKADGVRLDDVNQRRPVQDIYSAETEQQLVSRTRPSLFVLPLPSVLVGYQDDWLKTSTNSLQHWEKAPLEPYALQKNMTYHVVCPDIDPLTSAAGDFFQQLGTVYETCKLGSHLPQNIGNQMDIDTGKWGSSGFVLLDCPQSMKIESSNASFVGSISDYFLSLSNGWDLPSFLKSLSKVLKALKVGSLSSQPKEASNSSCMVIYVVCPFPEPAAVLQTVIESSVAVGSLIISSEKRSILHNQVGKALSCSAVVDEASISNVLTLSGFSIPKLVVQIVTVDAIFRVTSPALSELIILKELAFTVFNKGRRISRGSYNDMVQSSSGRSHSVMMQISSPMSGMWKDCVGGRMTGSLPREGELDPSLRGGAWDNSWQAARSGVINCDSNRMGEYPLQDETRYMYEPLFILAEPGSIDHGASPAIFNNQVTEASKPIGSDNSGGFMPTASSSGNVDNGPNSQLDGSDDVDGFVSGNLKSSPSLHCCYGWTEDWRWLVCIWTDSRGELLDSQIFPFGGISGRQDTKGLQSLFVQVLQQGCQILHACCSSDTGTAKPRDFIIARIGSFYELECQEWQKAIYSFGGLDVKKWPLQLRRPVADGIPSGSNGTSMQQQEMGLIQDRNIPASPNPLYTHSKSTAFMKGGLGQPRKQIMGGSKGIDSSRGLFQWVQSISFVALSVDHSLNLVCQADISSPGGIPGVQTTGASGYPEGYTPVRSLGSISVSYILIPSPSMRFLPATPLQLPTCLTAESPPLAHLLHSKGYAIPLSTGFVVSKAVPSMRRDLKGNSNEEWPSVLSVSLIDHYGGSNMTQEKVTRGSMKQGGRSSAGETKDYEVETHIILETIAAELHALSWMTVSPAYMNRRTPLPFHCDMVLRLRRLIYFADKELSKKPEKQRA